MPLKAGVVQFSPLYGRVVENLDNLERWVQQGAEQGAKLLVLPEMAWTGYLWPNAAALGPFAEEAGFGPGQSRLQAWARRFDLTLVCGFPERCGTAFFNSQTIVTPEGTLGPVYRKQHLFEADTWWAEAGTDPYLQWAWKGFTVGSGICMDLNDPDLVQYHASQKTSVLAFSTNWLDEEFNVIPYWEERLHGAEAPYEGYALFANRGGQEWGVSFRGQSAIFENGRCLASLSGKDDGVLVAELTGLSDFRPEAKIPTQAS